MSAVLMGAAPRRWIAGAVAVTTAVVVALILSATALVVALDRSDAPASRSEAPADAVDAGPTNSPTASLLEGCVIGRPC